MALIQVSETLHFTQTNVGISNWRIIDDIRFAYKKWVIFQFAINQFNQRSFPCIQLDLDRWIAGPRLLNTNTEGMAEVTAWDTESPSKALLLVRAISDFDLFDVK